MKITDTTREELSLAMQQYYDFKINNLDCVVFFQLGDFYEMFFEDAIYAAKNIGLTLTKKSAGLSEKVPLAGIPLSAADDYIKRLIDLNQKVVIVNQRPKGDNKKLVDRYLAKIITPGSYYDETKAYNNFVAALYFRDNNFVLSYGDINTGEMYYTFFETLVSTYEFISSREIKEIIVNNESLIDDKYIYALRDVEIDLLTPIKDISCNLLLNYFNEILCNKTEHLKPFVLVDINSNLRLNYNTINHLDLITNDENSLFNFINKTHTSMGKRMLRHNLLNPLTDLDVINARHDFINYFENNILETENIKQNLIAIYDIERFIAKVSEESINPKELENLKNSLIASENIFNTLKYENLSIDVINLVEEIIKTDAPITTKDGNYINDGIDSEIDRLRDIKVNSNEWLQKFENEEIEKTGIKNLRIKYNRIFGYFLEVTNSYKDLVPENYIRKQTTANAERYITEDLKVVENEILNATDKLIALELEIYNKLKVELKKYITVLSEVANKIAYVDMIYCFYKISVKSNLVKPIFSDEVKIKDCFHPIVKSRIDNFISNDIIIDDRHVVLITGPNMAGKSTYMRQMAITVIMAQMGSYVPASSCEIKIFDQIFTRIGASDNLANNQSTFMVEMSETATALKHATCDSLLLFDELGRGTSTYDGIALAQSIIEYLCEHTNPITLFSTHYHELVTLQETNNNVKNIHVKAIKENNELVFLHKVHEGGVEKSYGIEVARLANLPMDVIARANLIINELDTFHHSVEKEVITTEVIVNEKEKMIIEELREIDLNNLTPLNALNIISKLKEEL